MFYSDSDDEKEEQELEIHRRKSLVEETEKENVFVEAPGKVNNAMEEEQLTSPSRPSTGRPSTAASRSVAAQKLQEKRNQRGGQQQGIPT